MTFPRTRAILNVLKDRDHEEIARRVLAVFGATSIDDCIATYEVVGAAERTGLDDAVERLTASSGAAFQAKVDAEAALGTTFERPAASAADPYADLQTMADESTAPQRAAGRMQSYRIGRVLLALGRSYGVEDADGTRRFRIAGKVRFARTFAVKDMSGNVLYSVREKLLVLDSTFLINRDGAEVAVVRRTSTGRDHKYEIVLQPGETLQASGRLWADDGVQIIRAGARIAYVWRQQNVLRERFGMTVSGSADQALMLAIGMAIVENEPDRGAT